MSFSTAIIMSPWLSARTNQSAASTTEISPVGEKRYSEIVKEIARLDVKDKQLDSLLTWLNGFIFGVGLGATVAIVVMKSV
jgi:hypothetical protein